jgi:hypothetical protein
MALASYLVGLIGFLAFVAIFLLLLHVPTGSGWFTLEILTGLVVHVLTSIAGSMLLESYSYWYQASLYAFLWFCFFFVTSIYSASVSVGIISYLYKQPDQRAPIEQVYQDCVVRVFKERIEFLILTKQIQETQLGYISTTTGKRTAQQLHRINQILGMQSQGFYSSNPIDFEKEDGTSNKDN